METEITSILSAVSRIFFIVTIVTIFICINKHDGTVYTDYEISDCRYFVTTAKYGGSCEWVDVFYEDTKITIRVSSIEIDTSSYVRVYDDIFGSIKVYMTKTDYLDCIGQKDGGY